MPFADFDAMTRCTSWVDHNGRISNFLRGFAIAWHFVNHAGTVRYGGTPASLAPRKRPSPLLLFLSLSHSHSTSTTSGIYTYVCFSRPFTSSPLLSFLYISLLRHYCRSSSLFTHNFFFSFLSSFSRCAFCTASEIASLFDGNTVAAGDTVHMAFRKAYARIDRGMASFFRSFLSFPPCSSRASDFLSLTFPQSHQNLHLTIIVTKRRPSSTAPHWECISEHSGAETSSRVTCQRRKTRGARRPI